jgi:hypothetical protein
MPDTLNPLTSAPLPKGEWRFKSQMNVVHLRNTQ